MVYKGIAHRKINLFFNYYKHPTRQHEIDEAMSKNADVFDRIITVTGRPTFTELFSFTKEYPNDINCFCNSDIYFTDLSIIKTICVGECFAITRDDLRQSNNASGSQDAWCFLGEVRPIEANFTQGLWGCDNRLAYEIDKAGYELLNPPIYLGHLHAVDLRDQRRTSKNTVPSPYMLVPPLELNKDDKGKMYIKGTNISDRI